MVMSFSTWRNNKIFSHYIKNYWGPTTDVRVGIEFAEFEDTSKATILESEIAIGSISPYSKLKATNKSLKIKIADNVNHNIDIQLKVSVWSGPNKEYISSTIITITVIDAIIIDDYITVDTIFEANKEYIIQNSLVVAEGATLTIEEGVILKLSEGSRIILDKTSSVFSNGTKENPVTITSDGYWNGVKNIMINANCLYSAYSQYSDEDELYKNNKSKNNATLEDLKSNEEFKLCPSFKRAIFKFTNFKRFRSTYTIEGTFEGGIYFENCIFSDFYTYGGGQIFDTNAGLQVFLDKCVITGNDGYMPGSVYEDLFRDSHFVTNTIYANLSYNSRFPVFSLNKHVNSESTTYRNWNNQIHYYGKKKNNNFINLLNERGPAMGYTIDWNGASGVDAKTYPFYEKIYFGSASEQILSKKFLSFRNSDFYISKIDYSNRALQPFDSTHGIVWKVLVNGKDAQDEYDQMDPIGVGNHEFKVYFQSSNGYSCKTSVSYGVRFRITQKQSSENWAWSSDGKIYTVTHDLNIGAADGINRIRVLELVIWIILMIPVEDIVLI